MAKAEFTPIEMGVVTFTREEVEELLIAEARKLLQTPGASVNEKFRPQIVSSHGISSTIEMVYFHLSYPPTTIVMQGTMDRVRRG
jgi:hypothetical protein